MRVPFAVQSYRHRSLPVSAQRLINLMTEAQPPDAKARAPIVPTPGMSLFGTLGGGPVRGLHVMGSYLYAVSAGAVWRIDTNGVGVEIGQLPSTATPVSMAANGTQLVIVVPEAQRAFIATRSEVVEIVSDGFEGSVGCAFVDGYIVHVRPNSKEFFLSALNDAATYDALDFASAERSPDNIVAIERVGAELWLFGETTTEIFQNVGGDGFPFQRISGAFIERGCSAPASVAQRMGAVCWLGDDRVVYRAEGFAPVRISTHAIEQAIGGYADVSDAVGWIYELEGHVHYVLTFPSAQATWVYDLTTQLWHERESEGYRHWRGWIGVAYAGGVICGDPVNGNLYRLNPTLSTEAGAQIIRQATGMAYHAEGRRAFFNRFAAEFETGVGLMLGQGSDPQVWLQHSDDGGRTWSNEKWAALGEIGQFRQRVEWRRLGAGRDRVFRLGWADPVYTTLTSADLEIEAGQD